MSELEQMKQEAEGFREDLKRVTAEVQNVIVGQDRVVEATITALMAGGHVLLEGVPGLGKTELVKTLGHALELDFRRIQFTPDLMPADIIGTNIMNTGPDGSYRFEFKRGPIFTQVLLADEINRATPKTQSALLETMQEGSVTTGGVTMAMKPPYFVLATQNPIEQEGTYPLPEAQLDRFMFKVTVPFLNRAEMNEVLSRTLLRQSKTVSKVLDADRILALRRVLDKVVVADPIRDYAARLVLGTHPTSEYATEKLKRYVRWGASPRAAQALIRGARVHALADGRVHTAAGDIRHFAGEVLAHRVLLNYDGQAENIRVLDLVNELLQAIPEVA